MKTNINGFEVEGTVQEIKELVMKKSRKPYNMKSVRKSSNKNLNRYRTIARRYLRTGEPLGRLISKAFGRTPAGTDYTKVRTIIKKITTKK